jgi:hypothetical protein
LQNDGWISSQDWHVIHCATAPRAVGGSGGATGVSPTTLLGNYVALDKLSGHCKTLDIFPGITTALVFNAKGNATKEHQAVEKTADDDKGQSFIKQKAQENAKPCSDSPSTALSTRNNECPVTGLHCEPIANMAVHLHGFW